jgi:hypothetical protein
MSGGPVPLGANISSSPLQWQVADLEEMLLASRIHGVPMIVGSAGETATNRRVDLFVGIIRDLARKQGLARFNIGYFCSEVSEDSLSAGVLWRVAGSWDWTRPTASSPWPASTPASSSSTRAPM